MADFFKADISLGSISSLEHRTSEVISAPVDEAREYVKEQSRVHMDETGWYVAHKRAWLWVAATELVTVFLIRPSRGGKVAKEMLGEPFKGILSLAVSLFASIMLVSSPTRLRDICRAQWRIATDW